jgi:hypothetical protein
MPSKKPKQTSYLTRFLNLKCAGDVLNVTRPINGIEKEITESMAVIKYLKDITMKSPGKHTLYDMCAGNALTSVIAAHLLPVKHAFAIDKGVRKRHWELVRKFTYMHSTNIRHIDFNTIEENSIIIGVHACSKLAETIVNLYMHSRASHLILVPCCISSSYQETIPSIFTDGIGKYAAWAWHLSMACNGKLYRDDRCLSARNLVVVANKKTKPFQERDLVAQLSKAHRDKNKLWQKRNAME